MTRYNLILLIAATLTLTACSDDAATNNGTTNNDPTPDVGADTQQQPDASADAAPDAQQEQLAVASVAPSTGDVSGGTAVTVSGTGFEDGAQVFFGDAAAEAIFVSSSQFNVTTPPASAAGIVDVAVENPGGERASAAGAFEYTGNPPEGIASCSTRFPAATSTTIGTATEPIFGRVLVEGCTDAEAQCQQVSAELGWGTPGINPSEDPDQWSWTQADYNSGHTANDEDEYQVTLTPDSQGSFAYAYRFSIDGGATWTYCDLDGSENGFDPTQTGALTVSEQTTTVTIEWCNLQWPPATSTTVDTPTETIYGRVFVDACTADPGACPHVTAEVGFGATDVDPSSDPASYNWKEAAFNPGHTSDNNDEFQASVTPTSAGTFNYAYRFSGDGGSTWTYCDLNGLAENGFETDQLGELTVTE